MSVKRCKKCNREMGFQPPSEECAPCALGFTNGKKETNQPDNDSRVVRIVT
jgi:hypothetical protein